MAPETKDRGRLGRGRLVRTPTVIQMEAVECGAAALGIVLAYFGRRVPLEELRAACGVSRDGSKALNVVKAARGYGLTAKAFRMEPEDLRSLKLPLIVFWELNHFLVVEGFGRDRVYLNDPACGPRTVSNEEFDQSFTGIVLTFEPGPDFRRGGGQQGLVPALGHRLGRSRAALAYVVLAGLLLVIPGLALPTFTQVFVDKVLVARMHNLLAPLLFGLLLTAAAGAALTWLQQFYLLRLEAKLALNMAGNFFWHVLRLPVEFFAQRYAGEVASRVALNDQVAQLLSGDASSNALNLVMIVFFAAVMFRYDVLLTAIGIAIALVNFGGLRLVARRRADGNQRLLQEQGKLMGTAMGGLQNIETLKASGTEADFFSRWAGYQAKAINAEQSLGLYSRCLSVVPSFLTAANIAVILGAGGFQVMTGHLTIGGLVAFQGLMGSFLGPVTQFVGLGTTLQTADGNLKRLDDVLRHSLDPQTGDRSAGAPSGGWPVKLSGFVELRGLTFGYSRLDPPLIEGLSLSLKPGMRVAVVGGSGSGKSTLAKLLSGLYEPWSGEILLDGMPRHSIPRRVLGNSVALVDQDIFLFEGSVWENLTLWDETVPDAPVLQAARDACIHEDVAARPGGYASRVEEGGANFSGGQRQRLEIARALAGNPSILVLDEATSALDTSTEQLIDGSLRRRGCCCLIIAHRLSTIRDCDEIIVLDRGKVVQRGTHEELRGVDGPYTQLIALE